MSMNTQHIINNNYLKILNFRKLKKIFFDREGMEHDEEPDQTASRSNSDPGLQRLREALNPKFWEIKKVVNN